ncbi:class I SAM-dependent methyltransferase [Noviherbaspirillum sp.]|uniref:class I SAM-dependent methyltransferase n=1 Tax=Noviherbaspirillum sp. TaxID=1926288 RepID=UPI002FE00F37
MPIRSRLSAQDNANAASAVPLAAPIDASVHVLTQGVSSAHPVQRSPSLRIRVKFVVLGLPGVWIALIPVKLFKVYRLFMRPQMARFTRLAFLSREVCNYSFHHTDASTRRLAVLLANHLDGISVDEVLRYCGEVDRIPLLQAIYQAARNQDKVLRNLTDRELRVGRQLLYFCLVRVLKPRLVFEAGTAHGLGSLLLLHALKLNAEEGRVGRLITVDMNPNAGKLLRQLPPDYQALVEFELGHSEVTLAHAPAGIDLFFHDTANIPDHESRHYELLREKLSARGVICTTWGTGGQLAEFSIRQGRRYFEFTNEAHGHWCNDTLGISIPSTTDTLQPLQ